MYKAVIQAGGKGTRLSSVTGGQIPKSMALIDGKPLLQRQIETLIEYGTSEIVLIIGHLGHKIREYFGSGEAWGVKISYIEENEPLGSAGALYFLKEEREDFFLVFGDTVFNIDLQRMMRFHKEKNAAITLLVHPNSHPYDSDIVLTDGDNKALGILPKNAQRDFYYSNLVNAAFFALSPKALESLDGSKADMEKDLVSSRIKNWGDVFAYASCEYIKDAGTPERFQAVQRDIKTGVVQAKSLKNKQICVFLDRDGTLNRLDGYVNSPEKLELLPDAAAAVKRINESGMLAILVTNQPVVARGECTLGQLAQIHAKLETELGKQGAYLDAIYFCPHHPDKGFEGEVKELKCECECRKPKAGMLFEAAGRFNIDLKASYTVGDSPRDIWAGKNAGTKTVLIGNACEALPDWKCASLAQAVELIISHYRKEKGYE